MGKSPRMRRLGEFGILHLVMTRQIHTQKLYKDNDNESPFEEPGSSKGLFMCGYFISSRTISRLSLVTMAAPSGIPETGCHTLFQDAGFCILSADPCRVSGQRRIPVFGTFGSSFKAGRSGTVRSCLSYSTVPENDPECQTWILTD